ncbi:hypothetical protein D4764_11G0000700 [Takifugu flavidus]|uniref:Uncharacterized protein n=1 Tax=Takifugu flavidus TaxID=433684 RepID=A0A5C6PG05_9TELE|nr:hypothetical protein D4764_11G0000700 [Takifugu flavidus]
MDLQVIVWLFYYLLVPTVLLTGVSYFMTGTRDLESTTPNYCFDKGDRVDGSPPNLGEVLSEVCLTSYPIIQSNSLPDGEQWTTQLPSSAVWPGGTNNNKRPIHRCRECGPPVYRSELQHMEAEMGCSE